MKVAVIGGAGHMGSWFVRHFSSRGHATILADLRAEEARAVASAAGAELAGTNTDAVRNVDLALVCVPIDRTREVILEIAPLMRRGSVLAEVSSIKRDTVVTLRKIAALGVQPLSIHPLFGPAAETLEGKTIAVVPVIDGELEAGLAGRLFGEAEIVVSEREEHDRAMAVVLSLTYFMNLTFAQVLGKEDLLAMKRLSGTTFTVQLALAESIVGEDPSLVASLLRENKFTERYVDRYLEEAEKIKGLIKGRQKGFVDLYGSLRSSLGRDPDFSRADERRYRVFEALRG